MLNAKKFKINQGGNYPEDDVESKNDVFQTTRNFTLISSSTTTTFIVVWSSARRVGCGRHCLCSTATRWSHFNANSLLSTDQIILSIMRFVWIEILLCVSIFVIDQLSH